MWPKEIRGRKKKNEREIGGGQIYIKQMKLIITVL
jgi:hypothetical protein